MTNTDFYDQVPQEMKDLSRWVTWRIVDRDGYPSKNLFTLEGYQAKSNDPATWTSFDKVKHLPPTATSGIGFVFNGDGIVGSDTDDSINPDGTIYESHRGIFDTLSDTYHEITPGGKGFHFIFRCKKPPYPTGKNTKEKVNGVNTKHGVEIYSNGKFFTVTGSRYGTAPSTIRTYPVKEIRGLIDPFLPKHEEVKLKTAPSSDLAPLADKDILNILSNAANSAKFNALWRGSTVEYRGDDSVADLALAGLLAFYCRGDAAQIERLMRQSGLARAKWDTHKKYLSELTIRKAIDGCSGQYDPNYTESRLEPVDVTNIITSGGDKKVSNKQNMTEDEFAKLGKQENPRLTVNLPKSLITDYIEYMRHLSDGFSEYQLGGALAILSTIINRRACLDLNVGTIFTNIWIFILGVSTISRKSTAIKRADEMITSTNPWAKLSFPGSGEAFIEDLEGDRRTEKYPPECKGHGILIKDEAAQLLANMQRTHMSGMRDVFCDFYECTFFSRMLRSGQRDKKTSFVLNEPYLNILLATTPDNFSSLTNTLDLTSGWLLRFLFIFPNYERKLRDKTARAEGDKERYNAIVKQVSTLTEFFKEHTIEFNFSITGQSFYNQWERDHVARIQKSGIDDRGAFDRLSVYALKLSMIYTVAKHDFIESRTIDAKIYNVDIDDDCLVEACRQVDEFFLPNARLVSDLVGKNEEKNFIEKTLGAIKRAGGKLTRTLLMRRVHLKRKDLDDALEVLKESGEVVEGMDGGERCYILR